MEDRKRRVASSVYVPPHLRNNQRIGAITAASSVDGVSVFQVGQIATKEGNDEGKTSQKSGSGPNLVGPNLNTTDAEPALGMVDDTDDDWMDCDVGLGLAVGGSASAEPVPVEDEEASAEHQKDERGTRLVSQLSSGLSCSRPAARSVDSGACLSESANTSVHTADELRAMKCSLVVTGFPADLSEHSKESLLEPLYRAGGRCKWVVGGRCLMVFASEASRNKGLRVPRNDLLKVEALDIHPRTATDSALAGKTVDIADELCFDPFSHPFLQCCML